MDFSGSDTGQLTHALHPFPAKFPAQLPRKFIEALTEPGDVVLDPMMGSGTTIVEAYVMNRRAIGCDIDPLAVRICDAKVTPVHALAILRVGKTLLENARMMLIDERDRLARCLDERFRHTEREFINYWFRPETQLELMALLIEIEKAQDEITRRVFELTLSGIIIAKSGGVSLARDLAHTRPHKVEDKTIRCAFDEFEKRLNKNIKGLQTLSTNGYHPKLIVSDARNMALGDESVDLIITSPPYASNAIDYMRAHKFSLVWLGYPISELSELRQDYIGHDAQKGYEEISLPPSTESVISQLRAIAPKKANVLRRYYAEMSLTIANIARVLRTGKAAIIVVGSSTLAGMDTQVATCFSEIGNQVGLQTVAIATRKIDRNRRMMPARHNGNGNGDLTGIEQRMHEEYVIGFIKVTS